MKPLLVSITALLVLTACAQSGGSGRSRVGLVSSSSGQTVSSLPKSSLVPAKDAAAVARRSPGYVATPAPKFSGAGTPQPTYGRFPEDQNRRRSSGYFWSPYINFGTPYFY